MSDRRNGARENDIAQYTAQQVEAVLQEIEVEIDYDTENDFLCFCPFHGGFRTPSFSVSKTKGKYICFNGSCNLSGSLVELVKKQTGESEFSSRRLIISKKKDDGVRFADKLKKALNPTPDFVEFPQKTLDRLAQDFWKNPDAVDYMHSRGFEDETLVQYGIGYSAKKRLITVPMYSETGLPIGMIGRSFIGEKRFRNSDKLPKSKTLWNLQNARRHGETVIITEASFDGMRVSQAGYPNVVAVLGGSPTDYHLEQLNRNFNTIIIMTDFDKKEKYMYNDCGKCARKGHKICRGHNPGRDIGEKIVAGLTGKRILWASYGDNMVYPDGAKDAGDMTDDQIRQCLKNAVHNYTYQSWGLY